jgi:hypothetical protein
MKANKGTNKEESKAYHEAGHAVLAYRFGVRWMDCTIIPKHRHQAGSCSFWGGMEGLEIKERILVTLGGHAAQKAYDPKDKSDPSLSDFRSVWRRSEGMTPRAYNKLFLEVDRMIQENWPQIQAVANALMEVPTLEGGMCACIIESVDRGEDWRQDKTWIVTLEQNQAIAKE